MWNWIKELFRPKCRANQTQIAVVRQFITQHGSISTIEARDMGIKHLRSVICKMRKKGYKIKNTEPNGKVGVYKFK